MFPEQNQNKQAAISAKLTLLLKIKHLFCLTIFYYFTLFYGAKFKHNMEAINSTRKIFAEAIVFAKENNKA